MKVATRYVLAVDPGKTTGWCLFDTEDESFLGSGQLEFHEFLSKTEHWLASAGPSTAVIAERFTITMNTAQNSQAPWSLEVIGALRYLTGKYAAPFDLSPVSTAKKFASNDRLKRVGWYVPGNDHENDARRHLLVALVNARTAIPDGTLDLQ